jgi:O-antigen/teichoic acid export membrane protein
VLNFSYQLISFSNIIKNAGWNIVGTVLPLLAAVLAIPFLVEQLGLERFGLLSLVWIVIGYFSFFDLGLGRAVTKVVAELLGKRSNADLDAACSTAIALCSLLGVFGALILVGAAALAGTFLENYSAAIRGEMIDSVGWVAVAVPLVVLTSGLRGILEGHQQFRLLNLIRAPAGVLLFAAPSLSAWHTSSLAWAAASLVIARFFVFLAHFVPTRAMVKLSLKDVNLKWAKNMLQFGGWIAVSNVVGPVIVYADRIVIGSLVSAVALAFYSAPFEVVSRLLLLPTALTAALFPALASTVAMSSADAKKLRQKATLLILATVTPLVFFGALSARLFLELWLGAAFADNATRVMQILLLGFLFNSLAQVPFSALHSYGVAKQPALVHLAELPVYLALLFVSVRHWGLEGAAWAWTARALLDLMIMAALLRRWDRRELNRARENE